ncbi:MAG: LuxR family transcriptional regulator [Bacteroidia bacterium]|nr:MAG: LuxR family transcriptional regulator [Bacteroidia bacterium]
MGLIIIIIFIFCAALAAGSILLASRLMKEYQLPFARSLFYHIIFIFAFGFYGIWGQFIITGVAGGRLTPELLSSVSVISLLLGLPFLVFGWMMLLRFVAEITMKGLGMIAVAAFLLVNFGVIIALGVLAGDNAYDKTLPVIKYYYASAAILYSVVALFLLLAEGACLISKTDRRIISAVITGGTLVQAAVLLFLPQSVWMALLFVFLLFVATSLIPVVLSYKADITVPRITGTLPLPAGIEDFFIKTEISPREADIIREICNGLSNQEIADKLFISLQTVKDHTSRIYTKTNVRNRMQLMTMVSGLQQP